ncbi:hypothetical protein PCK1_000983 [Pneumocystis canis]|nr:hypothetical protein PCK1_000983 [Pneumocystis canis]
MVSFREGLSDIFSCSTEATSSQSVESIHDTFKFGSKSLISNTNSQHPLEAVLRKWKHQEHELKMESLNRIFGMSEPIRRKMELKILDSEFKPLIFGGPSNIHHDILIGNDSNIDKLTLYLRTNDKVSGSRVIHNFFVLLCTKPGMGICFQCNGWYPKSEIDFKKTGSALIYNKILSSFIFKLKITLDVLQQELFLKVCQACPELIAHCALQFSANIRFEPRLSVLWLSISSIYQSLVLLPVPSMTILGIPSELVFSSILENIIPLAVTKVSLNSGLRNDNNIVVFFTANLIISSMDKYCSHDYSHILMKGFSMISEDVPYGSLILCYLFRISHRLLPISKWWNKKQKYSESTFTALIKLYLFCKNQMFRREYRVLISCLLRSSNAFAIELHMSFGELILKTLDDVKCFSNKVEVLVDFLGDSLMLFMNSPYKYMDDLTVFIFEYKLEINQKNPGLILIVLIKQWCYFKKHMYSVSSLNDNFVLTDFILHGGISQLCIYFDDILYHIQWKHLDVCLLDVIVLKRIIYIFLSRDKKIAYDFNDVILKYFRIIKSIGNVLKDTKDFQKFRKIIIEENKWGHNYLNFRCNFNSYKIRIFSKQFIYLVLEFIDPLHSYLLLEIMDKTYEGLIDVLTNKTVRDMSLTSDEWKEIFLILQPYWSKDQFSKISIEILKNYIQKIHVLDNTDSDILDFFGLVFNQFVITNDIEIIEISDLILIFNIGLKIGCYLNRISELLLVKISSLTDDVMSTLDEFIGNHFFLILQNTDNSFSLDLICKIYSKLWRQFQINTVTGLSDSCLEFLESFVNYYISSKRLLSNYVSESFLILLIEMGLRNHILIYNVARIVLNIVKEFKYDVKKSTLFVSLILSKSNDWKGIDTGFVISLEHRLIIVQLLHYFVCNSSEHASLSVVENIYNIYTGTMNIIDRVLLDILQKNEKIVRHNFFSKKIVLNIQPDTKKTDLLKFSCRKNEIIVTLSSELLNKSIYFFPIMNELPSDFSKIHKEKSWLYSDTNEIVYDPSFFLPFVLAYITSEEQLLVKFLIDSSIFGYILVSLSSTDKNIRKMSLIVQNIIRFSEKSQVMMFFHVLKSSLSLNDIETAPIPYVVSLFMALSIQIITTPSHFLFDEVCRFYLQRPRFDFHDIPMFYSLWNATRDYYKQNNWLISLLSSGLRSLMDYELYKKRHIFELLCCLFSSNLVANDIRFKIIALFCSASKIYQVNTSFVRDYGMISWVEQQIVICKDYTLKIMLRRLFAYIPISISSYLLSKKPITKPFKLPESKLLQQSEFLIIKYEYWKEEINVALRQIHYLRKNKRWTLKRKVLSDEKITFLETLENNIFLKSQSSRDILTSAIIILNIMTCLITIDNNYDWLDIYNRIVTNSDCNTKSITISNNIFHIPPKSSFILGNLEVNIDSLINFTQKNGLFDIIIIDIIIIDPPWQNKSSNRKGAYSSLKSNYFLMKIPMHELLAKKGIIGIWVTNKKSVHHFVENKLLKKWKMVKSGSWCWLKVLYVTDMGEPIFNIQSFNRKPFEELLFAQFSNEPEKIQISKRIIAAVPDLHSRKPCLKNLLNSLINNYKGCEFFSRNLIPGWFSIGNQTLKAQWDKWNINFNSNI